MPEMHWTLNVQVDGGTTMSVTADAKSPEAIDKVEVVVDPGDTDKVLEIQPGSAAAIQLLVIKSNVYGADLTYKVSDGTNESATVTLDAPQVFSGGNVTLFGEDPQQIKFSNAATGQEVKVQVFVARDATPDD